MIPYAVDTTVSPTPVEFTGHNIVALSQSAQANYDRLVCLQKEVDAAFDALMTKKKERDEVIAQLAANIRGIQKATDTGMVLKGFPSEVARNYADSVVVLKRAEEKLAGN